MKRGIHRNSNIQSGERCHVPSTTQTRSPLQMLADLEGEMATG